MEEGRFKVLAIDDSETVLLLIYKTLKQNFKVVTVRSAIEGLEIVDESFDIIILDIMMPKMNGVEFLKEIRLSKQYNIPVLVLTAKFCSEREIENFFKLGASDYVTKPFLKAELVSRVKHHASLKVMREDLINSNRRLKEAIRNEEELNKRILNKTIELKNYAARIRRLNRKLRYYANHDRLTRTYNRRAFFSFLKNDIMRQRRNSKPISLLMFDIDHFKSFNDNYGHLTGDYVLKKLVNVLKEHLREIDLMSRFGGEEFLILLPDTALVEANIVANKLVKLADEHSFLYEGNRLHVTISIGVAEYKPGESRDALVMRVDSALYQAKRDGRNCVRLAD